MLTYNNTNIAVIRQDKPQVKQTWFIIDAPMFFNNMFIRFKDFTSSFYKNKFLTYQVT